MKAFLYTIFLWFSMPLFYSSAQDFPKSVSFILNPLSCDEFPAQSRCKIKRPETNRDRPKASQAPPEHFWKYNYQISLGKVALLFVLDISSSMSVEHRSLAEQLSPFLKSIKDLKYHVALITMDISSSPNNPVRGAYYQDGRFIPIGGKPYLKNTNLGSNPNPSVIANFQRAIQREETIRCDKRNQPRQSSNKYDRLYQKEQTTISCPSGDERGTYAMNLAILNPAYRSFFDRDHVLFIPITDEDVRNGREFYNQPDMEKYRPEGLDLPETLVANILKIFPRSRTFSFHPIIIPPGNSSCLNEQNRGRGPGSGNAYYGRLYAKLTDPSRYFKNFGKNFLKGSVISICNRNYGSQLSQIARFAKEPKIPLPCDNPKNVKLFANGNRVNPKYRIKGRTLYIKSKKPLALSSKVEVEAYCK